MVPRLETTWPYATTYSRWWVEKSRLITSCSKLISSSRFKRNRLGLVILIGSKSFLKILRASWNVSPATNHSAETLKEVVQNTTCSLSLFLFQWSPPASNHRPKTGLQKKERNKKSSYSCKRRSLLSFCNKEWSRKHSSCQGLKRRRRMPWKSKKRRNIPTVIMMARKWKKRKRMKVKVRMMSIGLNRLDCSSSKVLETKSRMIANSTKSFTSCRKHWSLAATKSGPRSSTASSQLPCVLLPLSKPKRRLKAHKMLLFSCQASELLMPMKQGRLKEEWGLSVMLPGWMLPKTNLWGFDPSF